jgi:beta-glucosidase
VVEAWYPGQAGGEALADVLFGDYNPGGRLPVTFYRSTDDLPPFEDYRMEGRTYRYFRGEPLYPFGYGLSYTTFAFDDLTMDRHEIPASGQVAMSVSVTNTGDRAGDEVVQLYVRHPDAAVARPIQELKGFKRVSLDPGERKRVTFTLHVGQLGYYDEALGYAVQPGTVEVLIGKSARDLALVGQFRIAGQPVAPGASKVFFSHAQVATL